MSPEYKCKRHSDGGCSFSRYELHCIRRCLKENIHITSKSSYKECYSKECFTLSSIIVEMPIQRQKDTKSINDEEICNMI